MKKLFILFLAAALMLGLTACGGDTPADSSETTTTPPTTTTPEPTTENPPADDITLSFKVGDIIKFGEYDWRVLDIQGGKALIITEKITEIREYHTEYIEMTWEHSEMRAYLNSEFYNSFKDSDKAQIIETTVINDNNKIHGTNGGNDTTDYIFLLSLDEVNNYFADNEARIALDNKGSACRWWLRTPGESSNSAAYIGEGGFIYYAGYPVYVDFPYYGVRPAMWIEPADEPEPEPEPEPTEIDLSPLEVLTYQIDDDGTITISLSETENKLDIDNFRKYFFGVWEWDRTENPIMTIDDSEESWWILDYGFWSESYETDKGAIVYVSMGYGETLVFWVDMKNPGIMYYVWALGFEHEDGSFSADFAAENLQVITKTDQPINEPQNGYLSELRMLEISRDYGIDLKLLYEIGDEELGYHGSLGDWDNFPTYLISEAPDKLVMKTRVALSMIDDPVDVIYTLEKIDGKWVGTIEELKSS